MDLLVQQRDVFIFDGQEFQSRQDFVGPDHIREGRDHIIAIGQDELQIQDVARF